MSVLQEAPLQSTEQVGVSNNTEHLSSETTSALGPEVLFEQEINRLLTEVDHLVNALDTTGSVHETVKSDVSINLETALSELSMPYAVTRTAHKVETGWDAELQRPQRTFQWLGRCAVGVAESGYGFHSSDAAIKRVDVEVAEASHAQETLQPGRVQFFLSPRMSEHDAPIYVAKEEHLHDQDSIRASYLVTDSEGNETYRVMESLLVTDIPLDAWVALLRDEDNIFGRSIEVSNASSALAVMETFKELELPAEVAPEGPVTLVSAVVPYIEDDALRLSAILQLEKFRSDQELYEQQAERFGAEWYRFELELAKSLRTGVATSEVAQFILNIESLWSEDVREFIGNHALEEGYMMTRELAAIAEKAKRNIIATKAAIKTGNEKIIDQVDADLVTTIQNDDTNVSADYIKNSVYARDIEQSIVKQNVELQGGCAGGACGLEGVSQQESETYIKQLGGEKGDSVVRDKERKCACGAKTIVYVYNKTKVIKHCESCGATEKKITKKTA